MPIGPPQISAKDKPLRRKVALAYRTAREAGKSHDRAFHAAGGGAVHSVITGPK